MKYSLMTLGATVALTFAASGAFAQNADVIIVADPHGSGLIFSTFTPGGPTPLVSYNAPDPGPGGSASALTYSLYDPPSIVPGDVFLNDPSSTFFPGLIRFNPGDANTSASFVFYSLENGPASLPTSLYGNQASVADDPSGNAFYTPGASDPGYIAGYTVEYVFLNDAVVPEPSTFAALGFGVLGVAVLAFRARRRRTFSV